MRRSTCPAPAPPNTAIQYGPFAARFVAGMVTEFHAPGRGFVIVPVASNCPGPFVVASLEYKPTNTVVAVLRASKKTFSVVAAPDVDALNLNASATPPALASRLASMLVSPTSEVLGGVVVAVVNV
jgi:hypothetical protein